MVKLDTNIIKSSVPIENNRKVLEYMCTDFDRNITLSSKLKDEFTQIFGNHNKTFRGEIFNIGADKDYSLIEVAEIVQNVSKKFGYDPQIVHLETRDEVKFAYSNHDKAKTLLQFEDKTNIEQLVFEMFEWVKSEPNRKVKFIEYEINKNMYTYWKKEK